MSEEQIKPYPGDERIRNLAKTKAEFAVGLLKGTHELVGVVVLDSNNEEIDPNLGARGKTIYDPNTGNVYDRTGRGQDLHEEQVIMILVREK